jgi:hypothetical protein
MRRLYKAKLPPHPTPPHPFPTSPHPHPQALSFPLASINVMPWSKEASFTPAARLLSALSALDPSAAVELTTFAVAVCWVCGLVALTLLVAGSHYRERDKQAVPVKVGARGLLGRGGM